MDYISTRGGPPLEASSVALRGLAPDGGLYMPTIWPQLDKPTLRAVAEAPYASAAAAIIAPFVDGSISGEKLRDITELAYANFPQPEVTPLKKLEGGLYLLELFHGPTFSFKDIALQFLGPYFGHLIGEVESRAIVVGATSGDTGSAAIHAIQGRENIAIAMLHPEGRVSDIQRLQMTTVVAGNVQNIAVAGTFDDCQRIVKVLLVDPELRIGRQISTVNSINWFRIAAQAVYYMRTALRLDRGEGVTFVVPSGNFGNAFSAWVARKMGAPIANVIAATNRNDILARVIQTGQYRPLRVIQTSSPSMDIQTASNFERLVFECGDHDGRMVASLNEKLQVDGYFPLERGVLAAMREFFDAVKVEEKEMAAEMKKMFDEIGGHIDPHSAVALSVARAMSAGGASDDRPVVVCATAHPAKFPKAVMTATGASPALPDALAQMKLMPERYARLPNDYDLIKSTILEAMPA